MVFSRENPQARARFSLLVTQAATRRQSMQRRYHKNFSVLLLDMFVWWR
jgi:hypothetical protein